MRRFLILSILLFSSYVFALPNQHHDPLHLDLQASSAEYERLIQSQNLRLFQNSEASPENAALQEIVAVGKRNLDWLQLINTKQDPDLQFTKPGTLTGIPITQPSKYSAKTVLADYTKMQTELPGAMKKVLIDGAPLTETLPMAEAEYLIWGRKVDRLYQTTLRWLLMVPYLSYYSSKQVYDIRGFYFLAQEKDLKTTLADYLNLPTERQAQLKDWLIGQCRNNLIDKRACLEKFDKLAAAKNLQGYFDLYQPEAKQMYEEYFQIQNPRRDLIWSQSGGNITSALNFVDPVDEATRSFIKDNLEDEWHWSNWALKINFARPASVQMILQPGITPHVNGLGGNNIYMDKNAPFSEADVQFTIRHEFGHVLGFPDCYVEYYDTNEETMVNYQIDITNMMCSRAGKLQERHFHDLYKEYHH